MSACRCAKVCPFNDTYSFSDDGSDVEEEDSDEETENESYEEHGFFRKLSLWFQRPSNPQGLKAIQSIPGGTLPLVDFISMKTHGIEALTRKREKHRSSIFFYNAGKQEVFFSDWRSSQDFFDTGKVIKEPRFDCSNVNRAIIDEHIPALFSNGINHARRKSFLMSVSDWVGGHFVLPTLIQLVPEHLRAWSFATAIREELDFEQNVLMMADDLLSDVFFGTSLDFMTLQTWRAALFRKDSPRRSYQIKALEAFHELYRTVVRCPKIKEILVEGRAAGLSYDETVKEILFAVAFKGTVLSQGLTALIAQLTLMPSAEVESVKEEVEVELKDGLNNQSLKSLRKLEQIVLEVLRLYPPTPLVHGRARCEFVTESDVAYHKVKKDQSLACSIYQVQRDPDVYKSPGEFQPSRFEDKCLQEQLIVFGGNMDQKPKPQNRKCIGQVLSLTVLKVVALHLIYCDIEFKERPVWPTKRSIWYGGSDKLLNLKKFVYRDPPVVPLSNTRKSTVWEY